VNRRKLILFRVWIFLSCVLVSLFFGIPDLYCSTYPLNEESVFCAYFMMSGDDVNERDVEEFCFSSGRPVYTSFKPSEMFTKQSIKREKIKIVKKIESIGSDPLFVWELKESAIYEKKDNNRSRFVLNYKNLPQPTYYINSKITKSGKRLIGKAINSFLKKNDNKYDLKDLHIKVTLRPEKTAYGYQKRNIVYENVVLPIRYVIFHPIKVQILDKTMTID
jgi:hypothetical protein